MDIALIVGVVVMTLLFIWALSLKKNVEDQLNLALDLLDAYRALLEARKPR